MDAEYSALLMKYVDYLSEENVRNLVIFYDEIDNSTDNSRTLVELIQDRGLVSAGNVQMLRFIAESSGKVSLIGPAIEYQLNHGQMEAHAVESNKIRHKYRMLCELFVSNFSNDDVEHLKILFKDRLEGKVSTSRDMMISVRNKGRISSTDVALLQEIAECSKKKVLVDSVREYCNKFHAEIAAEAEKKDLGSGVRVHIISQSVAKPKVNAKNSIFSPDYINRDAESYLLKFAKLPANSKSDTKYIAIVGAQGTGKTKMALWYYHEHGHEFEFSRYICGDGKDIFHKEMQDMMCDLGIAYEFIGYESGLKQQRKRLDRRNRWLIVVDNFERMEVQVIQDSFPSSGGVVLLTSTNEDVLPRNKSIQMKPYTVGETIRYLGTALDFEIDEKTVLDIGKILGYNPHAISVCTRYMNEEFSVSGITKENLEINLSRLISEIEHTDWEISVKKIYEESIKKVKEEGGGAAWKLLCKISLLKSNGVNEELVESALMCSNSTIDACVGIILSLGLVQGEEKYEMHRLFQEVVHRTMKEDGVFISVVEDTIRDLYGVWDDEYFYEVNRWPILNEIGENVEQLWRYVDESVDIDVKGMLLSVNASYLSFVDSSRSEFGFIESKFHDLEQRVEESMDSKWKLNLEIVRSRYHERKNQKTAAMECLKTMLGPIAKYEVKSRAKLHFHLGLKYWALNKYDEAFAEYVESLELYRQHYGGNDINHHVAEVFHRIGWWYKADRNFEEARDYIQRCIDIEKELCNASSGSVAGGEQEQKKATELLAKAYSNYGRCFQRRDSYEKEMEYEYLSLDMTKLIYQGNENHFRIALKEFSIADIYYRRASHASIPFSTQFFGGAREYYLVSHKKFVECFGDDHHYTLQSKSMFDESNKKMVSACTIS